MPPEFSQCTICGEIIPADALTCGRMDCIEFVFRDLLADAQLFNNPEAESVRTLRLWPPPTDPYKGDTMPA